MSLIATDTYRVVVGIGSTGQSVARFLQKQGSRFCFFDTRSEPEGLEKIRAEFPDIAVYLGEIDSAILLQATEIVLSPGVARQHEQIAEAIAQGVPVVGDIALFLRETDSKVVGITGSNGKTTVTTMVGMAAAADSIKVAVGGNIGTPALDLLEEDADLYVLELSSFQLESINQPSLSVACVLNLSADHMDRYTSMAQYAMAKQRIYFGAEQVVYNLDDPLTIPPITERVKRYGFGIQLRKEEGGERFIFNQDTGYIQHHNKDLIHRKKIKIQGLHNLANACALFALCRATGISDEAVMHVLEEFPGLPHRCEWVAAKREITFINDSKATNVGATSAALTGLSGQSEGIVLIAGGDGKNADFGPLAVAIDELVKHVVLLGRDGPKIASKMSQQNKITYADTIDDAVAKAFSMAAEGETVLLSPACASFDMFDGYIQRGDKFREAVRELCA